MKNDSLVFNLVTSLPILGQPAKFLWTYTALGIQERGYCVGLLKGGLVGVIFFIVMLFLSEAIPLCWEVPHYYLHMQYVEPVKSDIRSMALRTEDAVTHPKAPHWHDRLDANLDWLNPGKYLLKRHPAPEKSTQEDK